MTKTIFGSIQSLARMIPVDSRGRMRKVAERISSDPLGLAALMKEGVPEKDKGFHHALSKMARNSHKMAKHSDRRAAPAHYHNSADFHDQAAKLSYGHTRARHTKAAALAARKARSK